MIYILMLVIAIFWRRAVLGSEDLTLYQVDVVDHPGPRGDHRPALEPVAHPAGLAQGPGAGDDRRCWRAGSPSSSTG